MKDIVITPLRIKNELITLLAIFFIGVVINMLAIIIYKGRWNEMFTSLPYVLLFTLVVYLLWLLVRIIVRSIIGLVKR
jgi:hypothetical protein